jgi:hypothetical protein
VIRYRHASTMKAKGFPVSAACEADEGRLTSTTTGLPEKHPARPF